MSVVEFKYDGSEDVEESFDRIRWPRGFEFGENYKYGLPHHLKPLFSLWRDLGISKEALNNADDLAKGYGRLLVVLREPSDRESEQRYRDMVEMPETIEEIQNLLDDASDGRLGWENACILDVRPLRFDFMRSEEDEDSKISNDDRAYSTFEAVVARLRPDVVVVCQCSTANVENETARTLSSRMNKAATMEKRWVAGKWMDVVYAFHPSVVRIERYRKERMESHGIPDVDAEIYRQSLLTLLRLAFHMAINKLGGRTVRGLDIDRLRSSVLGYQPRVLPSMSLPTARI